MGQIITFYSYKGGVGRTMALANVAVLLAKWGFKTLIVDWDLEAPGLEFYFKDYIDIDDVSVQNGIVELLYSMFEKGKEHSENLWGSFATPIAIPGNKETLDIITAGNKANHYFERVRTLDLNDFYFHKKGGSQIEKLRDQWREMYDFTLIDSRTGITDIGGICTVQLPDLVVALFTANDQSFHGVINTSKSIENAQQELPIERLPATILPIPSRFDTSEEFQESQTWLNLFSDGLEKIYDQWITYDKKTLLKLKMSTRLERKKLKNTIRRTFLETTKIPYITYFSFGEKLPVIEQGTNDPAGLGYAYETLTALLPYFCTNRRHFNFFVQTERVLTRQKRLF